MKKSSNTKKYRLLRIAIVISIFFVAVFAVLSIVVRIITNFNDRKYKKTENIENTESLFYDIEKPPIQKMLLTQNSNSRPGIALNSINGIVIHYTANAGTDAEANRNYFESKKDEPDTVANKVSSHYIIGLDGTIVQCVPLNELAYASNKRNSDTISIECCHPNKKGKFSKDTYKSLVRLVAWLCGKYGLSKDSIIRHYDITGKMCPLYYVNDSEAWNKLKDDIWNYALSHKKADGG